MSDDEKSDATSDPEPHDAKLEERLAAIELRLIAQEHRPLAILNDLRKEEGRSDRWWSAFLALFVRLFLASPVVATGAGVIAIAGVWFAYEANVKFEAQNAMFSAQNELVTKQTALVETQNEIVQKQNELVETQNELVRKQNYFFQRQIRQEAVQDFRARRAQLLRTIYDRRECWEGEPSRPGARSGCPAASIEARAEAATTLVRIERAIRNSPDDDWPGVVVPARTMLRRADLSGADLSGADLRNTNLSDAVLFDAFLIETDLSGALLIGANLSEAALIKTDLSGAILDRAHLSRHFLTGCKYCPSGTKRETRWPEGFEPPDSCVELPADQCNPPDP